MREELKIAEAYPLQWPAGQKREQTPRYSRFKAIQFARVRDNLLNEIKLLGGKNPIISTNIPTRNDGLPYANSRQPEDAGVAVYFQRNGKTYCFACDKWRKVDENLAAIFHSINAIRGIERWGSQRYDRASVYGLSGSSRLWIEETVA